MKDFGRQKGAGPRKLNRRGKKADWLQQGHFRGWQGAIINYLASAEEAVPEGLV